MAETKMKAVRPPDPSMEEILASIRRIISEEPVREQPKQRILPAVRFGNEPAAPRTGEGAVPAHARPEDVLKSIETADLAAALSVAKPAPPASKDGAMQAPRSANGDPRSAQRPLYASVVSPGTSSAAAEAFGSLARAVQPSDSRTMEEFVEDLLRPLLQSWLDENLPGLVERLVRQEIERVSRGVF
jgi:cell pole-organizing protein PopZ